MWGRSSILLRGASGHTRHTKVQTPPSVNTERHQECLRATSSHDIVLRDNDIPQLCKSWDENITNLVSGIPLELSSIWKVNHEIDLIDPDKHIYYRLPKCPEHFHEEPLHSGGCPQWQTKQCQCYAYQRKMVNYVLFSIYENRMTTRSRS